MIQAQIKLIITTPNFYVTKLSLIKPYHLIPTKMAKEFSLYWRTTVFKYCLSLHNYWFGLYTAILKAASGGVCRKRSIRLKIDHWTFDEFQTKPLWKLENTSKAATFKLFSTPKLIKHTFLFCDIAF